MKPNHEGMSLENLRGCAFAAQSAYLKKSVILDKQIRSKFGPGLHIHIFSNSKTGTEGFIVVHPEWALVSFRGTDALGDWRTNCGITRISYPYFSRDSEFRTPFLIHGGFLEAWFSVKMQVKILLKGYFDRPIFWTGHSLGGALAQLAAFEFGKGTDHIYTFGAPRVGCVGFANHFLTMGNRVRVVNDLDIVPHLPPEVFGFSHMPGALWYFNSDWELCDGRNLRWWAAALERINARRKNLFDGEFSDIADHRMKDYLMLCEGAKMPEKTWFQRIFGRG